MGIFIDQYFCQQLFWEMFCVVMTRQRWIHFHLHYEIFILFNLLNITVVYGMRAILNISHLSGAYKKDLQGTMTNSKWYLMLFLWFCVSKRETKNVKFALKKSWNWQQKKYLCHHSVEVLIILLKLKIENLWIKNNDLNYIVCTRRRDYNTHGR